ncbi:MAG: hypothetical protein K6G33_11335 [Ruminococcus sp.]|uniref:hypothetical protein n=1 Tax=Ruminococcus sp. TaxID=41978 RepID=UPI0025DFBAAB|nr:hypothetical protein [Ruminococcus sp.]MCR5601317.1 hypothetical protein [Ruminococcus sp.]
MDVQEINDLFELLTGEQNSQTYYNFINLSMYEVSVMLRSQECSTDYRLNFLCAAIAFYRVQQMLAARERAAVTYAGKMLKESQNTAYEYSKLLLRDYLQICNDLLKCQNFVFSSFSGEEDIT